MADTRIEFRYNVNDVVSAQRIRFIRSPQFRLILLLWAGSILLIALNVLFPGVFRFMNDASWTLAWQIALAYLVTMVALLLIAPFLGFYFNRFWRLPLELSFSEKQLRLSIAGKSGGLRLKWEEIRRVEETPRVYIFYYGTDKKFFIIPKAAFRDPGQERRLRDLLATKASLDDQKPKAVTLEEE